MPLSSRTGISFRSWSSVLLSDTVTRAPQDFKKSAEATPERPSPTTRTRLLARSIKVWVTGRQQVLVVNYLSFRVVSANKANIKDAIQKRTMIFDSDQPTSSKWW